MFYQNWKLSLIAIIMIPIAGLALQSSLLVKELEKLSTEAQEKSGFLIHTHLIELFKNHKLIKIFQKKIMKVKEQMSFK